MITDGFQSRPAKNGVCHRTGLHDRIIDSGEGIENRLNEFK